ncbi:hypothetical protein AB0A99_10975 [Streptomyces fradiae]|uniref:hypothetical protein n=1 Tax=Streptomyces fradiae TaxID=1906 RepID=UPI0033C8E6C6
MKAAGEGRHELDAVSVLNAKRTLHHLLEAAGISSDETEELLELVEAGAVALAHQEVEQLVGAAPEREGEAYGAGWRDGARTVAEAVGDLAERALRQAVAGRAATAPDARPPVRRMEVARAKAAAVPLYLSFTPASDLDPEVTDQVLTAVLGTMGAMRRAAYAGRLTEFATAHHVRLERLYAAYGPGSSIAIHGRYSLVHSPTSVAVLERLAAAPEALREEWEAAELPPAWLDGLTAAWGAPPD